MKCHYELLEVDRDADDDVIKKSYRKLALKWHPDKNPDNIEETTKYFALLQNAYEVLSDPHERAFYDKHRESILKGGFEEDYKDEALDLFQYFSSSCYRGFTGDKGFYSVYGHVFETLSNEDYDFVDDPAVRYPQFGQEDSDYDTVVGPFYGFWSSFNTARSFVWLDKYDVREGENRAHVRAIEAENKKYRDAGKAERNDQIRELVRFIRKRDPRIKAYRELLELRQVEAKKKQEEHRLKQIQQNQERMMAFKEDEATKAAHRAQLEEIMADLEGSSCDSESDENGDLLPHCVACNKSFKTENALTNHLTSKQHKKQIQELKKHMREEDAALFDTVTVEPEAKAEKVPESSKKSKRRAKKKNRAWDENSDESEKEETKNEDTVEEVKNELENLDLEETKLEKTEIAEDEVTKEKTKKRRRAAKKPAGGPPVESSQPEVEPEEFDTQPKTATCDKCKEFFESRSKLFSHLKETGHATLIDSAPIANGKKTEKG